MNLERGRLVVVTTFSYSRTTHTVCLSWLNFKQDIYPILCNIESLVAVKMYVINIEVDAIVVRTLGKSTFKNLVDSF